MKLPRCINLDWLEVHALEPIEAPRDVDFFVRAGFVVHVRDYGTRVYQQMFTLDGSDGLPLIEVRRAPKSTGIKGIHSPNECHLRLHNRTCYFDNAADIMADFMQKYGYTFRRIFRVDICYDFEKFDRGDDPQVFLLRYLRRKFSKVNQGSISSHGEDTWTGQKWNSISWGSPTSDVGTKMYNKTLELYEPTLRAYKKPYIRQAWLECGLIDDVHNVTKHAPDGTIYTPQIWRIEFSIRSSVRNWFVIHPNGDEKKKQSIRNTLEVYNTREKLLTIFAALTRHYFRFKYFDEKKRKDLCEDKVLFQWEGEQLLYKVEKDTMLGLGTERKPLDSLLAKVRLYKQTKAAYPEIQQACSVLIEALEGESLSSDLRNPFSRVELAALRELMARRSRGERDIEYSTLLREISYLLKLNENTRPFL